MSRSKFIFWNDFLVDKDRNRRCSPIPASGDRSSIFWTSCYNLSNLGISWSGSVDVYLGIKCCGMYRAVPSVRYIIDLWSLLAIFVVFPATSVRMYIGHVQYASFFFFSVGYIDHDDRLRFWLQQMAEQICPSGRVSFHTCSWLDCILVFSQQFVLLNVKGCVLWFCEVCFAQIFILNTMNIINTRSLKGNVTTQKSDDKWNRTSKIFYS